jgi:hypothetical protein
LEPGMLNGSASVRYLVTIAPSGCIPDSVVGYFSA